jgi:CheY-like chemotaxis protein
VNRARVEGGTRCPPRRCREAAPSQRVGPNSLPLDCIARPEDGSPWEFASTHPVVDYVPANDIPSSCMSRDPVDVMTPRILVVDDERQIHASLRLRLGREYDLVFNADGGSALERIKLERFDLCFADIHMPEMDGLRFVQKAQEIDPALGIVILSAFDSDDNLKRAIPLRVFDFIGKPLPDRVGFEARIPDWVNRTRRQRRDRGLASQAKSIANDLASARMAQEVELVASETARDALLQTANLLTTIHAHLVTALSLLSARAKTEPGIAHLQRNLDGARKTADAAMSVAEGFFDSAYGSRDHSPALVNSGLSLAVDIARRMNGADAQNKAVDFAALDDFVAVRGLSGIDFLLLMVPSLGVALACAPENSTIGVTSQHLPRLDAATKDSRLKDILWLNRRNAVMSQPGILLVISTAAPAFSRHTAEAWLKGDHAPLASVTPRGLIAGVQKCRGLLGIAVAPAADEFRLALALPA